MFNLFGMEGPWGLVLILVGLAGVAAAIKYFTRTTPVSPVHRGKKDTCHSKFDAEEVRRTAGRPVPPITTINLPAPDGRVVPLLAGVTVAGIEKALKELTGEVAVTVGSKSVTIASRNTFHKNIELAITLVEEFYAKLGIPTQRVEYTKRGKKFYDVIAEIKGATRPDEVLIIGSHIDSTAGNTGSAEPVAPGADDDGSGTIAVLEIARALFQVKLGCTVRFAHFSGEEQGLWGSYVYSDMVARDKTRLVGMIQMDMVGWCAKPGNRVDIHDAKDRNGSHALTAALVGAVSRYGLKLNAVDTHNHAVDDRSDHAGFLDHGYKAVLVSEEFTDDGFNPNYHSRGDRVSTLNLPFMVEVVRMAIAASADLADIQ